MRGGEVTPKTACWRHRFQGFSLIELLVVLVIIAITVGFAVTLFSDFGRDRQWKISAQKLQHILVFLRETAVLEGENFVLVIAPTGYHVSGVESSSQLARATTGKFPAGGRVVFVPAAPTLQLEITSSGTLTPFELWMGSAKHPRLANLIGRENGHILLKFAEAQEAA